MIRGLVAISLACFASTAVAEPEPDKGSAKALMQSGLKLFAAKDYLGALAVFKDAYARFPSGKILLNIGTTLVKLDRPAEAANAYQRYLDSPDADPAKRPEAQRVLAELDRKVGLVEITVTPTDAEIEISDGWRPAAEVARERVMPGEITVRARRTGYLPLTRAVAATAGATATVALQLEPEPTPVSKPATELPGPSIGAAFQPERPSRFGALALAHVDPSNRGAAVVVGLAASLTERIQLRAAAILGPFFGGYAGGSVALLTGRVRPIVAVAVPVFRSEGFRVAVRGAGGVELHVNRHFAVIAEVGVEHLFNPQDSVDAATLFVPALGVSGRL